MTSLDLAAMEQQHNNQNNRFELNTAVHKLTVARKGYRGHILHPLSYDQALLTLQHMPLIIAQESLDELRETGFVSHVRKLSFDLGVVTNA